MYTLSSKLTKTTDTPLESEIKKTKMYFVHMMYSMQLQPCS